MQIDQTSDGSYLVSTEGVNWTILADDTGVTLVDAGYPGDFSAVLDSMKQLGHGLDSLRAVLVTHAHVDHIGSIPQLLSAVSVPVYTSTEESRHARREYLQQATPLDVARNALLPGMLHWSAHIVAKGALRNVAVPTATGVPLNVPLDVPGNPVPFVLPGHTSGHTCFVVGDVVITGDALCTGHMLSRTTGPQVLPAFFDHDRAQHLSTLSMLATLDTTVMHPGHGPIYRGSLAEAVEKALIEL
ncbi:MAG: MBL fold metallo-hydrolase [Nocardiaceae bacterium]|nr:MBL fold metallo-hydrolase [Nocardiaceae bacterium]